MLRPTCFSGSSPRCGLGMQPGRREVSMGEEDSIQERRKEEVVLSWEGGEH